MHQLKTDKSICKPIRYLLFLMVLVSPMLVLQVAGKELFLLLQIVFVLATCLYYGKFSVAAYPCILVLFFEPFIAGVMALNSSMPAQYQRAAVNLAIMSLPLFGTACMAKYMLKNGCNLTDVVVRAVKAAVLTEVIWLFAQLVLYKAADIDINQLVFVDTLHTVENASFVRSWVWYPSGLSWHSAVLAPLFVMGILFFDSLSIRLMILLASFLCGNSTTLLGVLLCAFLLMLKALYEGQFKSSPKKVAELVLIVALGVVAVLATDIKDKLMDVVAKLWERLFGEEKDASTAAHLGYYSDYLIIAKGSSLGNLFFGYGIGCSGYTITQLYGRYAEGGTWAIECDYINILVSRGIVGFIAYYGFLLYILFKGRKLDLRYSIFILVILFQGLGYNIQFDYLLFIELVMFLTIKYKVNFFRSVDRNHCLKRRKRNA